jgi:peptide-methionine (S)-S-oxide reductase
MNNKVIVIFFATFALTGAACNAKKVPVANEDSLLTDKNMKTEIATFGGGCFWCTEAMYSRLNGVISATSGYSAGHTANPTYKEVCTGTTGHAEVIQVVYNPEIIKHTTPQPLTVKAKMRGHNTARWFYTIPMSKRTLL